MAIAGAIIGAVGSYASSRAAAKAAKQGVAAQREALAQQRYMYDTTRGDLQPWREGGAEAFGRISDIFLGRKPKIPDGTLPIGYAGSTATGSPDYSEFYKSPGYQFRLDEGMKGIERSAAARGSQLSGRTLKELNRYGSDYASKEFGTYIDRLMGMATLGQNAAAQTGTIGADLTRTSQSAYSNIQTGLQNAGDREAAGYIGIGRNLGSAFGFMNNYNSYEQLST